MNNMINIQLKFFFDFFNFFFNFFVDKVNILMHNDRFAIFLIPKRTRAYCCFYK